MIMEFQLVWRLKIPVGMRQGEIFVKLMIIGPCGGFVRAGLLEGARWKGGRWWSESKTHKMRLLMTVSMARPGGV